MAKPSIRPALLRLLKREGPRTAAELAAALGVSTVAVRKHLDALAREGAVVAEPVRRSVGRPAYRYTLTAQAATYFPQGYQTLLLALLDALAEEAPEVLERAFARCSAALYRHYAPHLAGKPLPEQVAELARLREEAGFLATVEQQGTALLLREYHCPIRDVDARCRIACRCEQALFRALLGDRVEYVASLLDGSPACTYRIPLAPAGRPTP